MKKISIFIMLFALFCSTVSAQSAENVTEMIEAESISLADVAYFAATYLGLTGDNTDKEDALVALEEHIQFPKISENTDSLSYEDFAYFCTQVWNIEGGVMLRLTKAPRYAFKELQSMGYIAQNVNPKSNIDGVQALTIITECIEYYSTLDAESVSNTDEIDFESTFLR